jgi:hypothetical protein
MVATLDDCEHYRYPLPFLSSTPFQALSTMSSDQSDAHQSGTVPSKLPRGQGGERGNNPPLRFQYQDMLKQTSFSLIFGLALASRETMGRLRKTGCPGIQAQPDLNASWGDELCNDSSLSRRRAAKFCCERKARHTTGTTANSAFGSVCKLAGRRAIHAAPLRYGLGSCSSSCKRPLCGCWSRAAVGERRWMRQAPIMAIPTIAGGQSGVQCSSKRSGTPN